VSATGRGRSPVASSAVAAVGLVLLLAAGSAGPVAAYAGAVRPVAGDGGMAALRSGLSPTPAWVRRLDQLLAGRPTSVVVARPGQVWYRHLGRTPRVPASNEKLLLSMALLDRLGPDATLSTAGRARRPPAADGSVTSLWLAGSGDPFTARGQLASLADQVVAAGVSATQGVVGVLGPFARDTSAPGWKPWFPDVLVPVPTALTYAGNRSPTGSALAVPERRAASVLTSMLRDRGVSVGSPARTGRAPRGLSTLAQVRRPLVSALQSVDRASLNFAAEVLGKRLGRAASGDASISGGAAAVCALEARWGVTGQCLDSSGLSYDNRQTASGVAAMLTTAQGESWWPKLRRLLPRGGTGSLEGRLTDVDVRAKTGTLTRISALSGWVRTPDGNWTAFSILTRGTDSTVAKHLEDRVVRVLSLHARAPSG
jgi:D-alanyl-D-alanine carboxypeptidase/D-alanyl-D-alanine-endopeptidase (penicillin-binding protein 4)